MLFAVALLWLIEHDCDSPVVFMHVPEFGLLPAAAI
jgi:hypothetical protein